MVVHLTSLFLSLLFKVDEGQYKCVVRLGEFLNQISFGN